MNAKHSDKYSVQIVALVHQCHARHVRNQFGAQVVPSVACLLALPCLVLSPPPVSRRNRSTTLPPARRGASQLRRSPALSSRPAYWHALAGSPPSPPPGRGNCGGKCQARSRAVAAGKTPYWNLLLIGSLCPPRRSSPSSSCWHRCRSTRVARGSDKHSVQARALVVGLAKTTANAAWRQRAEVMAQATPHNPGRPTAGAATAPAQAEQAVTTAGAADALGARVEAAVAAQVGPNSALAPLHPPPPHRSQQRKPWFWSGRRRCSFSPTERDVTFVLGPLALRALCGPSPYQNGHGASSRVCTIIAILATVDMSDRYHLKYVDELTSVLARADSIATPPPTPARCIGGPCRRCGRC